MTMQRRTIISCIVLLAALAYSENGQAAPRPTPAPPQADAAADDAMRKMAWNEALNAGTNVRYWSTLAERADAAEHTALVWSICSIVFCLVFPYVGREYLKGDSLKYVGAVSEIAGILLCAWSLVDLLDHKSHSLELASIESRWTMLKPEFDELFNMSDTLSSDQLAVRFHALKAVKEAIVEPTGKDKSVMHQAWIEEMHARAVDPEYVAKVNKDRATEGLPTAN
jgi:hypothetical protein